MKINLPIIPTLFTILSLILLIGLGSWQVHRLLWKNNIAQQVSMSTNMPAINITNQIPNIEDNKYRKVTLKGKFLHKNEVHLFTGPRKMRGESGYNIITPLLLDSGIVIAIDRGWIPTKFKKQSSRPETLTAQEVEITGLLLKGEEKARFTPDNNIQENLWFWLDIPTIASFTGKNMENVYVRALPGEDKKNILPIAGTAEVKIRNDHLNYAITWYSLAIILLIIYILYVREWKKKHG